MGGKLIAPEMECSPANASALSLAIV